MENFFKNMGGSLKDPRSMHVLVLAYIGDAIYDLYVRTYLVNNYSENAHNLHVRAIGFVNAKAQSDALEAIYGLFDEEEKDVYRRGRNAKSATVPKNADVADYHRATGLEAVLGHHYVKGNYERISLLMQGAIQTLSGREKENGTSKT